MLLLVTLFLKRPQYALAFIPLLLFLAIGTIHGNGFASLMTFILSSIYWGLVSFTLYISDKKVNSNILGVDLKDYTFPLKLTLGCQGAFLGLIWLRIIGSEINIWDLPSFLGIVFVPNFLVFFIGGWIFLASLAIKISKTDAKLNKPTADRLVEDIKNLISQH